MVFDRFFIFNEGLTAVLGAFIVNKWAKWGRAKSAFFEDWRAACLLPEKRFDPSFLASIQTTIWNWSFWPNLAETDSSNPVLSSSRTPGRKFFCRASLSSQKKSLHYTARLLYETADGLKLWYLIYLYNGFDWFIIHIIACLQTVNGIIAIWGG